MNSMTQEINLIMKKVDIAKNLFDMSWSNISLKTQEKQDSFLYKGKVYEKGLKTFKHAKSRTLNEIEFKVFDEFFSGKKMNEFLFNLLEVHFQYYNTKWSNRYASYWWTSKEIKMNNGLIRENNAIDVFYHEVGHAWAHQLTDKAQIDITSIERKAIEIYFLNLGIKLRKNWKFKSQSKFIGKYISHYGKTSISEAFAELFALAMNKSFKHHESANDAIEKINKILIKNIRKQKK